MGDSVDRSDAPEIPRERSTCFSQADKVTIMQSLASAPEDLKYDVFLAISTNEWDQPDISHAKGVLGWFPKGSADAFHDE